jgi:hypothetical protein
MRPALGGLAGLRDKQRGITPAKRGAAIAKFRGDLYIDRKSRQALEPIFGREPRIVGSAAG